MQRLPTVVAMATIRKNATTSLVSCLILASEHGDIIILDSQAFTVLHHVSYLHMVFSQMPVIYLIA